MSVLVLLSAMALAGPTAGCAAPSGETEVSAAGARLFLAVSPSYPSDSVITVQLCLIRPNAGLGSYGAVLTFDSTSMRALSVHVSGGLQVANANVGGSIRLAGAASMGFDNGTLATIVFKPLREMMLSSIQLVLTEASAPSGASVLGESRVTGYVATREGLTATRPSASPRSSRQSVSVMPRIDSVTPRAGTIDQESVRDLVIHGKGFAATGNSVLFEGARVRGLASDSGGTVLRFMAPTSVPSESGVMRRVMPGRYAVAVRTETGTSNAVVFTVLAEDR